jgi:DNA-binding Lrp family transcriptional regulator
MFLDNLDRRLLNTIQTDFPLTPRPYSAIGSCLGISGDEVILRIQRLKAERIIRMIGPVIDARRLGFESSLIAAVVTKERLANAEKIIAEHPGVSHGYEREHEFNLWFTLAVSPEREIDLDLQDLNRRIQAERIISLPSLKLFKIGAYFDMEGDSESSLSAKVRPSSDPPKLTTLDKSILNELQQDLALIPTPFDALAGKLDLEVEPFLARCQALIESGAIRRFSASINHRQAGFAANAMCCWAVSPDKVDSFGSRLAELREVSHCYERKTSPYWRHNLFAMVHGQSKDICKEIVSRISEETGEYDSLMLYSTKEFKKQRVKYLV